MESNGNPAVISPLKESTPVRWSDHIGPALVRVYGTTSEFKNELDSMNRLRDSAIGVTSNASGRDISFRYFAQIELSASHIPTNPSRIEFTWHELYDDDSKSQHSVAFEKACVLYNLAAVLSNLGAEAWQSQDYKVAYHNFSCAAGVLEFISTSFLHAASVDIQPSTVSILSKLMLAQAQHCFSLKAANPSSTTKASPGLLAKLGWAACTLYDEANNGLTTLFDDMHWGDKSIFKKLEVTVRNLRASSYLHQSSQLQDKHQYGEAIACAQEARRLITDKAQLSDSKQKLDSMERENNLIFHERVPSVVPVIPETSVAKPLPLSSIYSSQEEAGRIVGRDLFEKVVPIKVHEKASLYTEMAAQFVRDQQEKSDIANSELDSALEYMDLPGSISRSRVVPEEFAEIPSEVLEWSAAVKRQGPLTTDHFKFDDQRRRIISIISSSSSPDIPNTVRESLILGGKTDAESSKMYEDISMDIGTSRSIDKLRDEYKKAACVVNERPPTSSISLLDLDVSSKDDDPAVSSQNFDKKLDEVSDSVYKSRKIKNERQSTLTDLREKIRNDDVTQAIISNQDSADINKTVFEPELRKFDPLVKRLDATIRLQKSVLNESVGIWNKLLASSLAKERQHNRQLAQENIEQLTNRLGTVYQTYEALQRGSKRAASFYEGLANQASGLESLGSITPPGLPVVPPKPPKIPAKPKTDGLNGYDTPSAYNPSMYQ